MWCVEFERRSLEEDVKGDTRGAFMRLLVSQLASAREERSTVDPERAHKDAADIYNVSE